MMLFSKRLSGFFLFFLFAGAGAMAQVQPQEEISDNELKQFITAVQQVQMVDQMAQQQMMGAIQEEEMEVPRFVEIMQAMQDPNQEVEATEEEMEKFQAASNKIEQIQIEIQGEMESLIVDAGLTIERYQVISMQIQSDPELQQRFQTMIEQG
jgi:hypothetical protein